MESILPRDVTRLLELYLRSHVIVECEGAYKRIIPTYDGILHGTYELYHDGMVVKRECYRNGKLHGESRLWYGTALLELYEYSCGQIVEYHSYHYNRRVKSHGIVVDGVYTVTLWDLHGVEVKS